MSKYYLLYSRLKQNTRQRQLTEGRVDLGGHNSRKQSLVVGEAWRQENEPASHTVSKAKKHQVINSGTPGFLFSPYNEPQSMGWCCVRSGWVFSRQLTVSRILYTVGVCFHGDSKLHKQIDNGDSPSPSGTERGLRWQENKYLAPEHNSYDEPCMHTCTQYIKM